MKQRGITITFNYAITSSGMAAEWRVFIHIIPFMNYPSLHRYLYSLDSPFKLILAITRRSDIDHMQVLLAIANLRNTFHPT
jgi:hypothetical protein